MADDIDDLLRTRMREHFPRADSSARVLEELQPRMGKARMHRRFGIAVSSAVGVLSISFGVLAVLPDTADEATIVDVTDNSAAERSLEDIDPTTEDPTSETTSEPTRTPTSDASAITATTTSRVVGVTSTTTEAPASTTAATTTTSAESTPSGAPDSPGRITTDCGVVEVELDGAGIRLVSTEANLGFSVETHNEGAEKVEVSFERAEDHCEVVAENRGGEIWIEQENE